MSWLGARLACLPLAIWIFLILGRGMYWRAAERDDGPQPAEPALWPPVAIVVPARDEADVIARSVGSLLAQDYPGSYRIILMDDGSSDGTADVANQAAANLGRPDILTVRPGAPLPPGWTG